MLDEINNEKVERKTIEMCMLLAFSITPLPMQLDENYSRLIVQYRLTVPLRWSHSQENGPRKSEAAAALHSVKKMTLQSFHAKERDTILLGRGEVVLFLL